MRHEMEWIAEISKERAYLKSTCRLRAEGRSRGHTRIQVQNPTRSPLSKYGGVLRKLQILERKVALVHVSSVTALHPQPSSSPLLSVGFQSKFASQL
ncbi:hypothetical protein Moror_9297 [Moniliophthora roreri MCA 2997]|uniref:Uncharacterized protein n=1 Tax=Moniliophthora roreri (strain MCA 2997) TaxID=1381753 RepID=V2WH36_MONRO|nr:hypothetical protein Moror_9297 [Moniliophthora roreri MCA 2997]